VEESWNFASAGSGFPAKKRVKEAAHACDVALHMSLGTVVGQWLRARLPHGVPKT
jgi:hypothetical protein